MPERLRSFVLGLPFRGARGALLGALLGAAFVGVGLLRYLIGDGRAPTAEMERDARTFVFYVAGFALAGAVADAAQPLLPGRSGTYARFGLGGAVVALMIVAGSRGTLQTMTATDWVVLPLLGVAFGCAFARGFTRDDPPERIPPAS